MLHSYFYSAEARSLKIKIAWIGKTKEPALQALTDEYLQRISRYVPVEGIALRDEVALLEICGRASAASSSAKSSAELRRSTGSPREV